ncbi:MAG: Nif3-like dinuclear metal center hexameric protein [Bacillota bacterium]
MFVNSKKIANLLQEIAPIDLAEDWDNVGFQVGNINLEIDRVLIALEVTPEVIEEAKQKNIDLIITHHPLIFSDLKNITSDDNISKMVIDLIKSNIHLYVSHTNMDIAEKGLNNYLANLLDLKRINQLSDENNELGLGIVGYLDSPLKLDKLSQKMKKVLNIDTLKIVKANDKKIRKVGICTGAGSDLISKMKKNGCRCFITGDIKYHEAQMAKMIDLNIIDATHFHTEKIFIDFISEYLNKRIMEKGYDVKIIKSEIDINPFKYN